jgi:hypothetical protein
MVMVRGGVASAEQSRVFCGASSKRLSAILVGAAAFRGRQDGSPIGTM